MKTLGKLILVSIVILSGFQASFAQSSKSQKKLAKKAAIKKMVEDNSYVFKANFANPQGGGRRSLTDDYDFVVSKDSLISYLPYFGRAYIAPANPTDGGIDFTSTKFDYKATQNSNGSWDVLIKPKDNSGTDWRDVQSLRLNISADGYASLSVISTNRDYISFDGYIEGRGGK